MVNKVYNFSGFRKAVSNIFKKQPVPSNKIDSSNEITVWETASNSTKNNFPQQLLQDVQNSTAASAALDVWQEFVEGGGFVDVNAQNLKVNQTEKLETLNTKVSTDISYLWGFSIHIAYNFEGKPTAYTHLPFEEVRLGVLDEKGVPKDIRHNPYYGIPESFDKKYTTWYYPYNPNPKKVVEEIVDHNKKLKDPSNKEITERYPGQVYWFSIERPLSRVYPTPSYYSAVNSFRIDKEIPAFHERNIKNNFLLSVILNVFGNPDDPAGEKDADGNQHSTVSEELDKQMRSFSLIDGGVFINYCNREEEKATLEKFPTNANDALFLMLETQTINKIAIGTKVPPILIGIQIAGKLGDTQEIINAIRIMQGRTARMRKILSSNYKKIFTGFEEAENIKTYELKNINPVNILSDWVVGELSSEEKRDYISKHFSVDIKPTPQGNKLKTSENGS